MKKLWVLFPLYNRFAVADRFLESLDSFELPYEVEVVIVDHGDEQYFPKPVNRIVLSILRESSALWWTGAVNVGLHRIKELSDSDDVLLLINDDVIFDQCYFDFIGQYNFDEHEFLGSVNLDQETGRVMQFGYDFNPIRGSFVAQGFGLSLDEIPEEVFAKTLSGRGVFGLCLAFFGLGFFDEKKLPHYGADFAYFWLGRKAGYKLKLVKSLQLKTSYKSYQKAGLFERLFSMKQPGNMPMLLRLSNLIFPLWYRPYFLLMSLAQAILFSIRK